MPAMVDGSNIGNRPVFPKWRWIRFPAMARLPRGVAPTPHNDRLKVYRADLITRGGRRLNIDLEGEANKALATVMTALAARQSGGQPVKLKDAVSGALLHYAAALSPPEASPARTPGAPGDQ